MPHGTYWVLSWCKRKIFWSCRSRDHRCSCSCGNRCSRPANAGCNSGMFYGNLYPTKHVFGIVSISYRTPLKSKQIGSRQCSQFIGAVYDFGSDFLKYCSTNSDAMCRSCTALTLASRIHGESTPVSMARIMSGTVPEQQQNLPTSPTRRSKSVSPNRAATMLIDSAGRAKIAIRKIAARAISSAVWESQHSTRLENELRYFYWWW